MQVLHLVLLRATSKPFSGDLFDFLQVDERLVDIGDDLVDYEVSMADSSFSLVWPMAHYGKRVDALDMQDDVLENTFNILRGKLLLHPACSHKLSLWDCLIICAWTAGFVHIYGPDAQLHLVGLPGCKNCMIV